MAVGGTVLPAGTQRSAIFSTYPSSHVSTYQRSGRSSASSRKPLALISFLLGRKKAAKIEVLLPDESAVPELGLLCKCSSKR